MYSSIIIDMFNLFYREKDKCKKNTLEISNHIIDFIENKIKIYQDKNNPIYLLFDPIPLKDLGMDFSFKYQTTRKKIDTNYKANRKKQDELILEVMNLVRKYYSHRGDLYIECLSDKYEADDYVDTIIKDLKSKHKICSIALYTTDEDWARYLEKDIVIINKSFNEPLTVETFYEKYKFIPTVASIQMFKALFGDPSDNIQGILLRKQLKRFDFAKKLGFEYVKSLGDTGATMADVFKEIHKSRKANLVDASKDIIDSEVHFLESIFCIDQKYNLINELQTNLSLIESKCEDYKKCIVSKPVDDKYNLFIDKLLNRTKEKRPLRFGRVEIKS